MKESMLPMYETTDSETQASRDDVLVRVEGVSKKFCRNLKKSLWYGLKDLGGELLGCNGGRDELRPDEFWAVKDVSFELKRGECLGLIGRNGAGKTTLLRMLNGLIKPDQGRIEMRGRVGALIALGAGFNPILTGRENIYVNAAVLGLSKKETDEKFDEIVDFAELGEFIDAPVQSYSSGMQVRLGFAIAATINPDILLLDEVLAVGDVGFQLKCFNTLSEFRERGAAFILVSHNMHHISRYANDILYLKSGSMEFYNNVEQGISHYISNMNENNLISKESIVDWSIVNGSGKVVITGIKFLNSTGSVVSIINIGESVTIEINYKFMDISIESCVLDVLARDNHGVVMQSCVDLEFNKNLNFYLNRSIRMEISSLPINSSYIEFFFCFLNKKTAEIYDWKRNLRLDLLGNTSSIARLVIPVYWNI